MVGLLLEHWEVATLDRAASHDHGIVGQWCGCGHLLWLVAWLLDGSSVGDAARSGYDWSVVGSWLGVGIEVAAVIIVHDDR